MNKKAQGMAIGKLLGWIIAAVILVLVGMFIYYFYSGTANPFFQFLPNFGGQKAVEGVQVLRYDIVNDKVEYYDGNKWIDFKQGAAELESKKVNYADALKNFQDYFYQSRNAESSKTLSDGTKITILGIERIRSGSDEIIVYPGYVKMSLPNNEISYLRLDDSIYSLGKVPLSSEQSATIKDFGSSWRDGVLKMPIVIDYVNVQTGGTESVSICVKKTNIQSNHYLVVDLTNSATTC